jgi:hypothetical protein
MPNCLRVRAADDYNAPESTEYFFLISTWAGGVGINLATVDMVSYLTQTGIHKAVFVRNIVRIASDKQRKLNYFEWLDGNPSKEISLNGGNEKLCSNILLFMAWKGMNKTRTERISSANTNSRPFCD